MKALLAVSLVLAACASPARTVEPPPPEPAYFDLALVQSHFDALCTMPTFDIDDPCRRMRIDGMTAEGWVLNVPTILNSAGWAPAMDICDVITVNQYGGSDGSPLGYRTINIADKSGGTLATCNVPGAPNPSPTCEDVLQNHPSGAGGSTGRACAPPGGAGSGYFTQGWYGFTHPHHV